MAFSFRGPHTPQPHARLWGSVQALPGEFKKYLVGIGIAGIGDFSNTLLILWATQAWMPRFGPARAVHLAMLFYVGYNVVYTASCYASGLLADWFPKHWVLASGYALCRRSGDCPVDVGRFLREVRRRLWSLRSLHGRLGDAREFNLGRRSCRTSSAGLASACYRRSTASAIFFPVSWSAPFGPFLRPCRWDW